MNNKTLFIALGAMIVLLGGYALLVKTPLTDQSGKVSLSAVSPTVTVAADKTVVLTDKGFSPSLIRLQRGQTILFKNASGKKGNISSDPYPANSDYIPLNLGNFEDGQTVSLTFDKIGSHGFHNTFDPNQKGMIVVSD